MQYVEPRLQQYNFHLSKAEATSKSFREAEEDGNMQTVINYIVMNLQHTLPTLVISPKAVLDMKYSVGFTKHDASVLHVLQFQQDSQIVEDFD